MLGGIRAAVTGLLVAACSTSYQAAGARSTGVGMGPWRQGYTILHVLNQNGEDVRVYLVRSGTRVPVGTVGSLAVRSFALSPAQTGISGPLTLGVETRPSRQRHVVELIDFEPGNEIEWRIEGRLVFSSAQPRIYRPQ